MTINTIFHALVFYKDNPFPKHPWFLKNPRLWSRHRWLFHIKIDTQAILILVGKFLCSLSYLYSIIQRKVDIFPPLKACYHAGYIPSSLYLLMTDQEEMRQPSRIWPPKSIQSVLYSEMPSRMQSNFSFSKGTTKLVKRRDYTLGSIV